MTSALSSAILRRSMLCMRPRFAVRSSVQRALSSLVCVLGVLSVSCAARVKPSTASAAGNGGSDAFGNVAASGAGTGSGGQAGGLPSRLGPDGGGCQQFEVKFEPKVPTVYLLVDRSGSMFHCLSGDTGSAVCATPANTSWSNLKEAVRSVVGTLEGQVRFGFTTLWGTDPTAQGTCPSIQGMLTDSVAPDLNNAAAIMAKYDALKFPPNTTQAGMKFESPTSESIQAVGKALMADPTPGDKYIILITDGQPDYCDDSNSLCAPDSVVAYLQTNKAAGISTIILGIQTALFDLAPGILQAYANAGAGEPTVAPVKPGLDAFSFYDQCSGVTGWRSDLVALAKPDARGTTLGTYGATPGPTKPYMPSAADQTQLVAQLAQALAGVKSCKFDLGGHIMVALGQLDLASVAVQGKVIPLDAANTSGWNMTSPTELQLFGSACEVWRDPATTDIAFNFPCDVIVE